MPNLSLELQDVVAMLRANAVADRRSVRTAQFQEIQLMLISRAEHAEYVARAIEQGEHIGAHARAAQPPSARLVDSGHG